MATWFCDAYASWQKGAVENADGRLRRDLPRDLDLDALGDAEPQEIVLTHNRTPRKCLGCDPGCRQQSLAAPRRHPPPVEHAVLALLAIALEPGVHRLAVDPDHLGRLALAQPLPLDQPESAAPQLLLRRPADAAKVTRFHPDRIAPPATPVGCIHGRLDAVTGLRRS